MAKDLPYFKFFCSEWSDGDITLEDYDVQGLFINICAYYWSNECDLSLVKLKKRFKNESESINLLIKNGIIKSESDIVSISFLDEQKQDRERGSEVKSRAGKASAEAKRLAKLKQEFNTKSTEDQHVLNLCSTESQLLREEEIREDKKRNISLSLENDFAVFWDKYNKKVDSRKCKDKFLKLKDSERTKILSVVDSYVYSTPDIQFRKNPLTWLNGKCWDDIEENIFLPTKDKPYGKTNQI